MNHQMRLLVLVFSSSVFVVEMCKQRLAFCYFVFTYSQLWGTLQMLGLRARTISSSIIPLKDPIPPLSPLQLDLYILNLQVYFLCYNCTISEYYEVVTPYWFYIVPIHLFRSFVSIVKNESADDEYLFLFHHNFGGSLQKVLTM